ncbi:hypothetical protein CANARDRAFT_8773 [[Candida] arabinofermentans NRRL YB-2248]|uniref:Man1/Src1-like C-terminal domain-containing protein n=1 Tax=[Candida] arabinofermentans NRRL YB-2248 TaxID=983967 RepID=A0A1E4SY63_9ASCO|nr:hypothetical protein CANARDRAFT_8773 [[Candida] arabinofermentans NRRL YB-2248]
MELTKEEKLLVTNEFDASILRVVDLRKLLDHNKISYPSRAVKLQLVKLVDLRVTPHLRNSMDSKPVQDPPLRQPSNASHSLSDESDDEIQLATSDGHSVPSIPLEIPQKSVNLRLKIARPSKSSPSTRIPAELTGNESCDQKTIEIPVRLKTKSDDLIDSTHKITKPRTSTLSAHRKKIAQIKADSSPQKIAEFPSESKSTQFKIPESPIKQSSFVSGSPSKPVNGNKLKRILEDKSIPAKRPLDDDMSYVDDSFIHKEYSTILKQPTNHKNNFSSSPVSSSSLPSPASAERKNKRRKEDKPHNTSYLEDSSVLYDAPGANGLPLREETYYTSPIKSVPLISNDLLSSTPMKDTSSPIARRRRTPVMPSIEGLNVSKSYAERLRSEQNHHAEKLREQNRHVQDSHNDQPIPKGPTKKLEPEEHQSSSTPEVKVSTPPKTDKHDNANSIDISDQPMRIRTPDISLSISDDEILKNLQKEFDVEKVRVEKESRKALKDLDSSISSYFNTSLNYKLAATWLFTLTILYVFTCYREKRIQVGFCGSEIQQPLFNYNRYGHLKIAPYVETLEDWSRIDCIPCPDHADCYPYSRLICDPDYTIYKPLKSLFGLIPTYNYCVLDSAKLKKIDEMTKDAMELLSRRNCEFKCGEGSDEDVGMSVNHLQNYLFQKSKYGSDPSDFDYLWEKSFAIMSTKPELKFSGANKFIRSTSLAKLSIKCKLKKLLFDVFLRLKFPIMGIMAVVILASGLSIKYKAYKSEKRMIKELSVKVITKLQEQAKFAKNSQGKSVPYIGKIQLRDYYLTDPTVTDKTRLKIWETVGKAVEKNSNVNSYVTEVRGEMMKVWEWISEI